jgi:hypothetical protein
MDLAVFDDIEAHNYNVVQAQTWEHERLPR